ncbi:MAG: histidine phosphatase family protein [Phycisphaerales bacterium]|nr:histidine phosphatase family protein [Phycisphaerales bacterium]
MSADRPIPVTIAFARHGKTHPGSATGRDRDRLLMPRGERQAKYLGEVFATLDAPPTIIIASPVTRARQTAELIQQGLEVPLQFDEALASGAAASVVLEVALEACHADPANVRPLIVGHNPTLEHLLALLTLGPGGDYAAMRHVRTGEAFVLHIPDVANPFSNAEVVGEIRGEE